MTEHGLPWDEYLRAFHRDQRHATSDSLGRFADDAGRTTYRILAETVAEFAAPDKAPRVLDLGCGEGRLVDDLRAVCGTAAVTGLDLSEDEIDRAHNGTRRARFLQGNAASMPFERRSFDAVLSHFAFMLMVPIQSVAREIERVLAPAGFFATIYSVLSEGSGDLPELLRLLNEAYAGRRHPARPDFDPRQMSPDGIEALFVEAGSARRLIHRSQSVGLLADSEGAWNFLASLYFFESLSSDARAKLRERVEALAASRGGTLRLTQLVHLVVLVPRNV